MVFAVVLFALGWLYVRATESALLQGHTVGKEGQCQHAEGAVCPYEELNSTQPVKYTALFIDLVLFGAGLFLFLHKKPADKVVEHVVSVAKGLGGDEKRLAELIAQSGGMIFQNEIVGKLGVSKVKATRLLDRLEAKGLVERRRRGMTNLVVLKDGRAGQF